MSKSSKWVDRGIKFVYLTGNSSYEDGYSHGKLLKDEIHELVHGLTNFSKERYGNFVGALALSFSLFLLSFSKRKFPNDLVEEMRGIADGSGVNLKWIIFSNSLYEVGARFYKTLGLTACSSFAVKNNSNEVMLGKTTDLSIPKKLALLFTKLRVVFIYNHPKSKKKFITFAWPMLLMGDSFMLENGTSILFDDGGCDVLKDFYWDNEPVISILRRTALESYDIKTVEENLQKSKYKKPFICILSNGNQNETKALEMANNKVESRNFEKYIINTNHFQIQEMISDFYKKDREYLPYFQGSILRYQNLKKEIEKFTNFSVNDAISLLQIHEETKNINKGSVANEGTTQSIIYLSKQRKFYCPTGDSVPLSLSKKWVEFDLDTLFKKNK